MSNIIILLIHLQALSYCRQGSRAGDALAALLQDEAWREALARQVRKWRWN